ncbi:MAG: phosphonopyruvate decarboxylase [Candidatus Marinimicrobia bacterium]|nr:phosphonopyruvate decarboxylase [Candidatus Neomarinimicrobiota bacterium]
MVHPRDFFDALAENGVHFFSGVPDSLLKNICSYITDHAARRDHVIAANEGNALSIGIGYHLSTGKLPLVYLQNSGLGNIVNPLLSLADPEVLSVPLLMMIGWRGEPRVKDEPQHSKQGRVTTTMLDAMGVPYKVLSPEDDHEKIVELLSSLIEKALEENIPCAVLVRKGVFGAYKSEQNCQFIRPLFREQAVRLIIDKLDSNDVVVSTTGLTSRELFENRDGHEKDLLVVGGMGHSGQIALGIALQKPDRKVYCLDGDGALLMHAGGLAITASMGCPNYKHIVFNNSAHDSVGGQPTVCGSIDLPQLARTFGYRWAKSASSEAEILTSIEEISKVDGPAFLEIQVKIGSRADLGRPTIAPVENKHAFMHFLDD